jgi:hypothetical protein
MKKLLSILSIVIAFSLNAQVTGVTLPNTKSGKIQIDTTGKNMSSWILYKVDGNQIVKMISYSNELLFDSLEVGNYWLLGQPKNPNSSTTYSYEAKYTIGIVPTNPCPTSNNIFIGMVHDVNTNTDLFCGQNNQGYQMQWYYDSIQIGGMPIQNCNSAIQMMNNGVLTLVGYGNTCNEYFTLGLGNNANYPPGTIAGGGGTSTASLSEKLNLDIDVFPNPFNDKIEFRNIVNSKIIIYDLLGNLIFTEFGDIKLINTTELLKGSYILEISNDMKSYRQMMIKQ